MYYDSRNQIILNETAGKDNNSQQLFFENKHQLLTYQQAAKCLGISESYLRRLKAQGKIPYVLMGGRGVRFRVGSLINWIEKREIV